MPASSKRRRQCRVLESQRPPSRPLDASRTLNDQENKNSPSCLRLKRCDRRSSDIAACVDGVDDARWNRRAQRPTPVVAARRPSSFLDSRSRNITHDRLNARFELDVTHARVLAHVPTPRRTTAFAGIEPHSRSHRHRARTFPSHRSGARSIVPAVLRCARSRLERRVAGRRRANTSRAPSRFPTPPPSTDSPLSPL